VGAQQQETAPVTDKIKTGRPLMMIQINGVLCTCFIDTGSEVTLIKESMKEKLSLRSFLPSSRTLRGASGHSFRTLQNVNLLFRLSEAITCNHTVDIVSQDVTFPGDVLLGMDFLRRFNFRLVAYHSPMRNYVTLNGVRFKLSYSDCPSLAIKVLSMRRMPMSDASSDGTTPILCLETVVCPPKTGKFISGLVSNEAGTMVAMVTGLTAQVLIPRSLVNVSGERVKIWVVNDRNKPVILQQGSPVAQMELTDEIFESHKNLCNDRSDGLSAQGNRVNCVNDFNCFSSVDDFDEFYCSDDFNGSNFDFIDGGGFDNCFNDLDEVYCFADSS